MPAKKAAAKSTQSTDMNMVWMWLYVVGTVWRRSPGVRPRTDGRILTWILLLVAVLVGLFYFDYEDLGQFGLRVLALALAKEGLDWCPRWDPISTLLRWLGILPAPVVLMMALKFFWHKRLARCSAKSDDEAPNSRPRGRLSVFREGPQLRAAFCLLCVPAGLTNVLMTRCVVECLCSDCGARVQNNPGGLTQFGVGVDLIF